MRNGYAGRMTAEQVEQIMQQAAKRPWAKAKPIIESQGLKVLSVVVHGDYHSTWEVEDVDGRQWKAEVGVLLEVAAA